MSEQAPVQTVCPVRNATTFAHSDRCRSPGNWGVRQLQSRISSRVMASARLRHRHSAGHYGGFWMRFGARMIDGHFAGVPLLILARLCLIPTYSGRRRCVQPGLRRVRGLQSYFLSSLFPRGDLL